jgi:pimeloyl-ACP methyl ester carboxylesterase
MKGAWLPDDVPDRSRLVAHEWGRVYACDVGPGAGAGDRAPLALVHDALVTSFAFHRLIPALAPTRRVIAPDLPGCGDSDRPRPSDAGDYAAAWLASAVGDTIAALGPRRFDLLGAGLGGAVALALALARPDVVGKLILVAPILEPGAFPWEERFGRVPTLGVAAFDNLYRRADLRRTLARMLSTPELLDESALDVYWDRLGRAGGARATLSMLASLEGSMRMRERVADIAAPTLLVWGDRDRFTPLERVEQLAAAIPGARLEIVEGCGHAVAEERADRLAELVLEHCVAATEGAVR